MSVISAPEPKADTLLPDGYSIIRKGGGLNPSVGPWKGEDMCGMSLTRLASVSAVMSLCMALAGCGSDSASVWSGAAKSPSGRWVSTATTIQNSGPGTAFVGTDVYLKWSASSAPPTLILGLSNESAYPIGITAIKMTWLAENHLDLGYCEGTIGFQAIKAGGSVDISAHPLSEADCHRLDGNG
jgi:hypothetical protein